MIISCILVVQAFYLRLEGTSITMMTRFGDQQQTGMLQKIQMSFQRNTGVFCWFPQGAWNTELGSGYVLWLSFRIGARV